MRRLTSQAARECALCSSLACCVLLIRLPASTVAVSRALWYRNLDEGCVAVGSLVQKSPERLDGDPIGAPRVVIGHKRS